MKNPTGRIEAGTKQSPSEQIIFLELLHFLPAKQAGKQAAFCHMQNDPTTRWEQNGWWWCNLLFSFRPPKGFPLCRAAYTYIVRA